jgi:carboxypeptidase PM20D1
MLKRVLLIVGLLLLSLVVAVAVNTMRLGSRQLDVPPAPALQVDAAGAAQRLGAAIRARTISSGTDPAAGVDQFQALHAHLRTSYPRVHATCGRRIRACMQR